MASANIQPKYMELGAFRQPNPSDKPFRFTTAGSVDDGKSTLIGRLLYDSQAIYEDQLASIKKSRINRSTRAIDFSLLTDGLRAEREQGITIDVAYRYFSTPKRKFIIADTPGHEQYTRNMATGASTADAAVILVDASKGLLPQSRRHAYITNLLGIRHVIAAVNKMDIVSYSAEVFDRVQQEFRDLSQQLGIEDAYAIPISGLEGDNVVRPSPHMAWFKGPTLLQYLEELPSDDTKAHGPVRFPVQYVIRPDQGFRGFAGQLEWGTLHPDDEVIALPSGIRTRIKSIITFDAHLHEARAGDAVTLTLWDEIDLSRGDMLVSADHGPHSSCSIEATLVWMHAVSADTSKAYLLKHTTRMVRAHIHKVHHRLDINTFAPVRTDTLEMNDIARVELQTALPLLFDPYRELVATGSFILIDPITNATVAAGIIEPMNKDDDAPVAVLSSVAVTSSERLDRFGHRSAAIWIEGNNALAERVERSLFDAGSDVHVIQDESYHDSELAAIARAFRASGVIAIFAATKSRGVAKELIRKTFGEERFFDLDQYKQNDVMPEIKSWLRNSAKKDE